ncbi:MAG: tRNA (guanosine(37)-N1)-methyltransferase TrmD [Deltaproteobacteria bacterium]|nr:MAG: tRNA (guanosine(37)-N1)-methyltransferase TrmD [Deltaproteobacteria bacterium]
MKFDILTLHPEMVRVPLGSSILGRATEAGLVDIGVHDIRDWAENKHKNVDDTPYGGGPGMVMRVDIVARALEALRTDASHVVLTSPAGRRFSQRVAEQLVTHEHMIVVCGHYEGIDARIETLVDEELSLGDFVLTGGEIAAVAYVDAVARLVPGVLGNAASAMDESFSGHLLEYPQYTRPREFRGMEVPDVLLSGHHARIESWRQQQAERRTRERRPDLWKRFVDESGSGE